MSEEWRPSPVRPDRFEVSSLGRVRSVNNPWGDRILRPHRNRLGYSRVTMRVDKRLTYPQVHRLVATAFLGAEPFHGAVVRHLDGNPANNAVINLAWGSVSENNRDTVRHGRHHLAKKTACAHGHEFTPENTYVWRGSRHCRACNRARRSRKAASKFAAVIA